MSRKNRKKRQRNIPQSDRARRQLEKGDAKGALKEAKGCFRAEPNEGNRQLLEEAYVSRVEQLHRLKQTSQAKTVLAELVKLEPLTPEIAERIPRLQVICGDTNANADAIFDSDPSLLVEMVDQAVLDPRAVVPDHGDMEPQVEAVRDALAAVERGDDRQAAERLTVISRNSPLADWRLLVRGLSAFYQRDDERTKKNWERLDATRPANRIAQSLLVAARLADPPPDRNLSDAVRKLELHVASDSALETVKQLSDAWSEREWHEFIRCYRQFRQRFAKSHEALLRQIVDVTWKRAVRECNQYVLDHLSRIGPAPLMDRHWHRAQALMAENPESGESIDEVGSAWLSYAQEVGQLDCLHEDERPIAVGLVYQRLAREFVQYAKRLDRPGPFRYYEDGEQEELYDTAAKFYRQSIESCPRLQASYLELADLHEENDQLDKSARVMELLARQDPECFDAAIWLAFYYLSQDEPGKSERHVATARRLRPRDQRCGILAWNQKLTMLRCLTVNRQFEAARQELNEAAKIAPEETEPYLLDLLRAGIEFKAKNVEAANGHVEAALAKVSEPTPVWMLMSSIAARMRVAREFKKTFDDRYKQGIKKSPNSVSAGRMARFLLTMKRSKVNYTGRATQEKLLVQYLDRALDIQWHESDLRNVCQFLTQLPREDELLMDFIDLGRDSFPQIPHFHYWAAVQEMDEGPMFCDIPEAIELFERAIELHNQGGVKLTETEIEQARSSLSMIKDYDEQRRAFAGSGPMGLEEDDYDFDDDDEDYDEDEYFDDEDEYFDDEEEFGDGVGFGMPQIGNGSIDDFLEEGLASAGIDEATLAMVESAMPPDMKKQLKQFAKMTGLNTSEALRMMVASMALRGLGDSDDGPSKPKAKMKKKPSGKRKR